VLALARSTSSGNHARVERRRDVCLHSLPSSRGKGRRQLYAGRYNSRLIGTSEFARGLATHGRQLLDADYLLGRRSRLSASKGTLPNSFCTGTIQRGCRPSRGFSSCRHIIGAPLTPSSPKYRAERGAKRPGRRRRAEHDREQIWRTGSGKPIPTRYKPGGLHDTMADGVDGRLRKHANMDSERTGWPGGYD